MGVFTPRIGAITIKKREKYTGARVQKPSQAAKASGKRKAQPKKLSFLAWLIPAAAVLLVLLVGFSRMYLGVHTPLDVVVSLIIGTVLVLAFHPLFEKIDERPLYFYLAVGALFVLSVIYTLTVQLYPWGADVDAHNLEAGLKNGYLLIGCSAALLIAFPLEKKYVNYDVSAPWWAQILKIVLGLGIVLGLKAGLKPVLKLIWDHHLLTTSLRYALLVLFAALVWPMTFGWFRKGCPLGRKNKT